MVYVTSVVATAKAGGADMVALGHVLIFYL
jgi:hypothetical protein